MNFIAIFDSVFYLLSLMIVLTFWSAALFFTYITKFGQIRLFPHFVRLITGGISRTHDEKNSIPPLRALLTAMSTTLGMGNIVGPSIAIMIGGPGALVWLLLYIFLGATIKFTEVSYAVATRIRTDDGKIIGGPMRYLSLVHPRLGLFYTALIIPLLLMWTSLQSNTFAHILAFEGIPYSITGICLSLYLAFVLFGGANMVSKIASYLFPIMFVLYVSAAFLILARAPLSLHAVGTMIINHLFSFSALSGGIFTATLLSSMQTGILRGIFISEAGIGTAAIPHALADTKHAFDQGVLAMCASITDLFLCTLSGLITLKTGIFMHGEVRSTLVYEAFINHAPFWGKYVLQLAASLFVLTTIVGNSFNALQNFHAITQYRYTKTFIICIMVIIIYGAVLPTPLLWDLSDILLVFVAIPHLAGLVYLACKTTYIKKAV